MPRIHAVELEDLPRFPAVWRDAGTAYLRFAAEVTGQTKNIRPLIEDALDRSGEKRIVDLCSGGGGPAIAIARELEEAGRDVEVTLTDLYPSETLRRLVEDTKAGGDHLQLAPEPVDATALPADRPGLRTMFNALHHFRPDDAAGILRSAVEARQPVAAVEVLRRGVVTTLGLLPAPLMVMLALPFLRPFRFAWLPFTYLLPIIPFFVLWDGFVSSLRVYDADELRELVARADPDDTFVWTISDVPMKPAPVDGIALVGIPRERLSA